MFKKCEEHYHVRNVINYLLMIVTCGTSPGLEVLDLLTTTLGSICLGPDPGLLLVDFALLPLLDADFPPPLSF